MPSMVGKNLHLCFPRFRRPSSSPAPPNLHNPIRVPSSSSPNSAAAAAVMKNFNSLYDPAAASDEEEDPGTPTGSSTATSKSLNLTLTSTTAAAATDSDDSSTTDGSSASDEPNLLSSAIASRRLLRPSFPGSSKAIADPAEVAVGIGVAVPTYSPDPLGDFRRSMEEMAAAMGLLLDQRRRDGLYELLLCYLALNRKQTHKYIVGAFADLLARLSAAADGEEDDTGRGPADAAL